MKVQSQLANVGATIVDGVLARTTSHAHVGVDHKPSVGNVCAVLKTYIVAFKQCHTNVDVVSNRGLIIEFSIFDLEFNTVKV